MPGPWERQTGTEKGHDMTGNMIGAAVCFFGGLALIGWMVHRFCVLPVERALDDAWNSDK